MTQHHHQHEQAVPVKATKKAALPLTIVGAVAGLFVAYIINKESAATLIIGLVAGAVLGFLFGNNIDRSLDKK